MKCAAARCGGGPHVLISQRRRVSYRRQPSFRTRAEPDPEIDPRDFDEGAAQVRRLMNRDKTNFSGPDFEALLEDQFSADTPEDVDKPAPEGSKGDTGSASPFGAAASSKAINPFSETFTSTSKLGPSAVDVDVGTPVEKEAWWSFFANITLTQIVLACSFILIISSMLGTFAFVLKSGAIHFND